MQRFYRHLFERGLTPPAALRAAQLEMLESGGWSHPSQWAAFVVQGDWK
jgi:CHAT domain-containing protein